MGAGFGYELDAVGCLAGGCGSVAGQRGDAVAHRGLPKHMEERRAMHRKAGLARSVGHIKCYAATRVAEHPGERSAKCTGVFPGFDGIEDGQTHRLDHQTRAKGAGRVEAFEKRDVVAVPRKEGGDREAPDPGSGDGDASCHGPYGWQVFCGVSRGWGGFEMGR